MARRDPAPGHNVKLRPLVYANATIAAAAFGLDNPGQYVEQAVIEKLERDRPRWQQQCWIEAHRRSVKEGGPTPYAKDFGLPEAFEKRPPSFRRS